MSAFRLNFSSRLLYPSMVLLVVACGSVPDTAPPQHAKARKLSQKAAAASAVSPKPPLPTVYSVPEAEIALQRLIPARVADAAGWSADITNAIGVLHIPLSPENLCSVVAIIEQESAFQVDPEVPNLPRIVMNEIETRRDRYDIPKLLVETGLKKNSPDGRSYNARIQALRTESDVSKLYEDMLSELPELARAYQPSNPIKTVGAMQVNVAFAEDYARGKAYPYGRVSSVRHEAFTRRGGIYFGVAMLLDYSAPYPTPLYRFADYNAGRFSSRNAAFQMALAEVSGMPLTADGDLLMYEDGQPVETPSLTQRALEGLSVKLGLSRAAIRHDLLLEKTEQFTNTRSWLGVYLLADATSGHMASRVAMPQIAVHSPKFNRTLTTASYALQVEGRWSAC
ncbi:MAG TPA: DUF1615 family protein, partial [Rhodocyclaceae bacterium]|nr:DUF1615 family protein [Rhodocyclaceae bacterium]